MFSSEVATRFRKEILSRGGTRKGMDMYRAFRGADPDKNAMLVARGLIDAEVVADDQAAVKPEYIHVDTRAMARQRAERSRRERAEAKMRADSAAMADSLAQAEEQQKEQISSFKQISE